MKKVWIGFVLMICNSVFAQQKSALQNGPWRGVLQRTDGNQIIFNFDVKDSAGQKTMYILNALDRLVVDDISYQGDSIFIKLPFFDSQFRAVFNGNNQLTGNWIKRLADRDVVIPFTATHNQTYRFTVAHPKPTVNITGRWPAIFTDTITKRVTSYIGVFEQKGTTLTGSFLTPSGDYRYLQGVVDGDSLKLSGFDGGFALLFTAGINSDSSISGGRYISGAGPAPQIWTAKKDDNAALSETSAKVNLKPDVSPQVSFTFKDVDGNPVSFSDERFKNKVVILQILGTWCPNCVDESILMSEIYQQYKSKGVEIIGLAYERTTDFARSQPAIKNFIKRLKIAYPVLITPATASDPLRAEKTLPQLEKIPAFPTTIFVDRKGEIREIHAGFSGPGTGAEYEKQKAAYYSIVKKLLAE